MGCDISYIMPLQDTGRAVPGRAALLVRGAHDGSGRPLDLLSCDGIVLASGPAAAKHPAAVGVRLLRLDGWALLPAPAEPHAHLDKAFLAASRGATAGALEGHGGYVGGAARAMTALHATMTEEGIAANALQAVREALRHGFTAVRSHVDVGGAIGVRAVKALSSLRRDLQGTLDLQLVALPVRPVSGPDAKEGRAALEAALSEGADIVGGCPWLDPDPLEAVDVLTATAQRAGVPIDLHVDESTDETVLTVERFALRVNELGLGGKATASHCVSLGRQSLRRARTLARQLAESGVAVVTLPQTNLWLQGRDEPTLTPRGLAPVRLLEEAGVVVCAGGDNWRDLFNPLGRADPLETAGLLVAAAHVEAQRAYAMVSEAARCVMGVAPARLHEGDQADFLAIRASGTADAVAGASEERTVVHRGEVVARSEVTTHGVLWP